MYPPVEKTSSIFFLFNKKNDFKVKKKIIIKFIGRMKILSNLGVFIISN